MFGANQSGLEMALRSMGLGSVLDAAKQLAESGAVQQIINFANEAGGINARLARIEAKLGIEPQALIEGQARVADPQPGGQPTAEPGSGPSVGDAA